FARIVMPFSRSRSPESMTRSATDSMSCSLKAPACFSIASTSVVLPWSTCATMATLRRFALRVPDMRNDSFQAGGDCLDPIRGRVFALHREGGQGVLRTACAVQPAAVLGCCHAQDRDQHPRLARGAPRLRPDPAPDDPAHDEGGRWPAAVAGDRWRRR